MKWEKIGQGVLAIIGVVALGLLTTLVGAEIVEREGWEEAFWARFQYMFIFAVLIERSVEVYLNASRQNGDDRFAPEAMKVGKDATRSANMLIFVVIDVPSQNGSYRTVMV